MEADLEDAHSTRTGPSEGLNKDGEVAVGQEQAVVKGAGWAGQHGYRHPCDEGTPRWPGEDGPSAAWEPTGGLRSPYLTLQTKYTFPRAAEINMRGDSHPLGENLVGLHDLGNAQISHQDANSTAHKGNLGSWDCIKDKGDGKGKPPAQRRRLNTHSPRTVQSTGRALTTNQIQTDHPGGSGQRCEQAPHTADAQRPWTGRRAWPRGHSEMATR